MENYPKSIPYLALLGPPANLDNNGARASLHLQVIWTVFSSLPYLFSASLSLGDGSIQTEILSQRVVKPETTNQP